MKKRKQSGPKKADEGSSDILKRFKERLEAKDPGVEGVIVPSKDLPPLSARVMELANPFLAELDDRQSCETILMLAVLVWNLTLLEEHVMNKEVEGLVAELTGGGKAMDPGSLEEVIWAMVDRKVDLYGRDRRLVTDHEISWTKNGPHLSVAYVPYDEVEKGDRPSKK